MAAVWYQDVGVLEAWSTLLPPSHGAWAVLSGSSDGTTTALIMSARLAGESPHAPCLAAGDEKSFVGKENKFKERF